MNQQIIKDLLSNYNLAIDIAENGLQAVSKVKQNDYQLVFMDIQMPEMDGYQATKIIREELGKKDLPIIAMTAHAMKSEVEKCLQAGMNDHVSKPIEPPRLFASLLKWIPEVSYNTSTVGEKNIDHSVDYMALKELSNIISVEKGLFYVDYKQALYHEMLKRFYQEQSEFYSGLQKLLGDTDVLQRKVHTVKGLAGSLGMEVLFECAAKLEQALNPEQTDNWTDLLLEFSNQLDLVLQALKNWLDQHPHLFDLSEPVQAFDQSQALALLEKIGTSLEEDLAAAKELVSGLKPMLSQHPDYKNYFIELENSLAEFDTEAAAEIIHGLTKQLLQSQ